MFIRGYNPLIGLDILCVQPISKAQAIQRAGRAGREMRYVDQVIMMLDYVIIL